MSTTNKRFFWITASILFALAMIFTLMPITAHAAVTDPLDPIIANGVERKSSLPAASSSYEGKYVDVNGKVYKCVSLAPSAATIQVGSTFLDDTLYVNGFDFDGLDASGDASKYITCIVDIGVGIPHYILAYFTSDSGTYSLFSSPTTLYVGQIMPNGRITSVYSESNFRQQSGTFTLEVPSGVTVTELPSDLTYIEDVFTCISSSGGGYEWELIHTHNLYDSVLEPATCTDSGVGSTGCTYCDVLNVYNETYTIPATGHVYTESSRKTECTTITIISTCSCGKTTTSTLPGPGHNYTSTFTPGTDTTLGYYTYVCSSCSHTYTADEEWDCDTDGHKWREYNRTGGTCTVDLVVSYECTVCSGTRSETTEAPGHNWLTTEKGDCTGVTIFKTCSACGSTETETGEPKPHNYLSVRHDGTDTSIGYTVFSCEVCNHTYTVYDEWDCAAKGHIGPESSRTQTCTELTIRYTCQVCEEQYSETDTTAGLGHDMAESSSSGLCTSLTVTYSCQRTGCTHTETKTEIRNHSYVQTGWQGPCDQAVVTYTCSTCDHSYTQSEPGAHDYQETGRTGGTCTEDTVINYKCSACNVTRTDTIDAPGHNLELIGFEASCTEGTDTYGCTVCDYEETREGTPLGHSFTIDIREEDGYRIKTYTCSVCNYVEEERTALPQVPSTGIAEVEHFVISFFSALASFFLYIFANVSFMGVTGLDLIGIMALFVVLVFVRRLTAKE